MRVLVIYVHPKRVCFTGELLSNVIAGLEDADHEVQVADLYSEGFNPAFGAEDYAQFSGEAMPSEVTREQKRIEWSEGIVIVSPIWWYQYPAMLKGWIDRVFSEGWAFADSYARGGTNLGWRKLLIIASAGGRPETYEKHGYTSAIKALWDVGIWDYCGFNDRRTEFFWRVRPYEMPVEDREVHMKRARQLARDF